MTTTEPSVAMTVLRVDSIDVVIWAHSAKDPEKSQWDVELAATIATLQHLKSEPQNRRGLIVSDLGAPNTTQRAQVREHILFNLPSVKSAAFTPMLDNPIKRGVAQAIMWMQPTLKFFRPTQWNEGLAHIGITTPVAERAVVREIQLLLRRMPANQTWDNIRSHDLQPRT